MNKWMLLAVYFLWQTQSFSQNDYNLVPNYSFEDSVQCPAIGNNPLPKPWFLPTNFQSGAFLHACSLDTFAGVPYNYYGTKSYQYPVSGYGYAALGMFSYRSYLCAKLNDTLIVNKCYLLSFFANLTNTCKFATNNISATILKSPKYVDTIADPLGISVIPANPQVYNFGNPVITDTQNWVKVSSVFVAHGGEQYITIGNFKEDSLTKTNIIDSNGVLSTSYYIDDVFIIPLDSLPLKADAGPDTTIALGDSLFIGSLTNGIPNITWYNSSGAVIDTGRPGFFVAPTTTTSYIIEQTVCGYYSRDTVTVTVNVMPLHWLGFTAEVFLPSPSGQGSGVRLNWQTANEQNVSHINIQRSYRGTNEFENIGQVAAKNKPYNEYSYIDDKVSSELGIVSGQNSLTPNPKPQTALYRLQSIDRDGYRSYSPIRRVVFNTKHSTLSVYPNPAKNIVTVSYPDLKNLSVSDVTGRVVLQRIFYNTQSTRIDVSHMPKGVFIIKVYGTNGNVETRKLLVE